MVLGIAEDLLARVGLPCPGCYGVAEQLLEQWAEGQLSVVGVGEQNHAILVTRETDQIVFRTVSVTLLEECGAVFRVSEQSPAETVAKADTGTFFACGWIERWELMRGPDADLRREHFSARGRLNDAVRKESFKEARKVVNAGGHRAGSASVVFARVI